MTSKYEIGVQEAGGTAVTEPFITLTVNDAATLTAIRAVTAFYTKTEI